MTQVLTFVDGLISSAHRDRLTKKLHGHTWHVRAYWREGDHRKDAIALKKQLEGLLRATFDHADLDVDLPRDETGEPIEPSCEGMAVAILNLLRCHKVKVWRPGEGMGATAKA